MASVPARRAPRVLVLAGLSLLAAGAAPAAPPGFLQEVLPNGMEVSILPDSTHPVVSTRLWYHVGAANEDSGTRGFAHLFEHLMFGGTDTRDRRAYGDHHHDHGGDENARTSWDETVYESDIAPAAHRPVLEMEADRMMHLRLDQENLDNEKRIVTEELRAGIENDPMSRVQVAALKAVLGEHPYAVTPLGTREDIAAASLERARDFYARYYKPRNAHLVVVGPVDGGATRDEVRRLFGALPAAGTTPADVPPLVGWPCPPEVSLKEDLPPAKFGLLGYFLPGPDAPDAAAVMVLREMLAGGHASPYREELVVRRRQALYAETIALELRRGGLFAFLSVMLPHRSRNSQFRIMRETVEWLARKEWLTEETLAAAQRRLRRRFDNETYFAGSRAEAIGWERWHGGDAARAFDRSERVGAVTRAEVAAAFDRYVGSATPVLVSLQPEKVPLFVRLFGWLLPLFMRG